MIKYTVLTLITVGVALAIYLYIHLGLARPVSVTLETRGPFTLVAKDHLGPYHEILPTIRDVEAWAGAHQIACSATFGEYLDDPREVDEDRLRSRAGCVLNGPPPIDVPAEFTLTTRAARPYAVGHFAGSPAVGPYTVYPKVRAFLDEQRRTSTGPVFEIYRVDGESVSTEYLFPLDNAL